MRKAVGKMGKSELYQLKIALLGIRPMIWRRVLVPGNIMLPKLHWLIQRVMGWRGGHLHAFRVGGMSYGEPDPDFDDDMENETKIRLSQIAPEVKSGFVYEYDFGDGWLHRIVVEKILPAEEGKTYPLCVTGKRACPPEDCGGPWGYVGFLEAIADPEHEEHDEMLEWVDGEFDPEAFDVEEINVALRRSRL